MDSETVIEYISKAVANSDVYIQLTTGSRKKVDKVIVEFQTYRDTVILTVKK